MRIFEIDELSAASPVANAASNKRPFTGRSWAPRSSTILFWLLALGLFLAASGCGVDEFSGSASQPENGDELSGRLTLTGSSTIAPMAQEIASRFEQAHPNVRVDVQTGGSSRGIRDAKKGAADIGMTSRDLKADESNELVPTVIAWDGVAFVVHQDNPIKEITQEQLRQIYLGKINNWSAIGGADQRIVVSNLSLIHI